MRRVLWFMILTVGLIGVACTDAEDAGTTRPPTSTPAGENIAAAIQLAGDGTGVELVEWRASPTVPVVVYAARACESLRCPDPRVQLFAVDAAGEQWVLADLAQRSTFEFDATGTSVVVTGADGSTAAYPLGRTTVPLSIDRPDPPLAEIPGFSPHNEIAATLDDGRYLIRGRWESDEPMESWVEFREPGAERSFEPQRPVRLFIYDPVSASLTPISAVPPLHEASTATALSLGPDTVLDVQVLPGGQVVAYAAGFNGAGYDLEYSLHLAPIPEP